MPASVSIVLEISSRFIYFYAIHYLLIVCFLLQSFLKDEKEVLDCVCGESRKEIRSNQFFCIPGGIASIPAGMYMYIVHYYSLHTVLCFVLGIDHWFALCKVVTPPDSGKVCSWNSLTDDFTSMFSWTHNFEKCYVDLHLSTSNYEDIKPADLEVRNVAMYSYS